MKLQLVCLTSAWLSAQAFAVELSLPTDNDAIFRGGGPEFYQYVTRDFKGVKSTPWEGGQYGFVRDPVETPNGLFYTRFHEGIDIRPMHRDANGEPLDEVRAVADGEVVYVNTVAGYSNYGRYIIVEHRWNGSPYYSLYGHLSSPLVRPRAKVNRGDVLGVMGYTGEGLDKERAHLHLELNLMLSSRFESWYEFFVKNDPNHHGIYNGINLSGVDIARLYLALQENPSLTIPEFLAREEVFYKVTLPKVQNFELLQRYPWLLRGGDKSAPSWEVSFNRAGVPLKVEPASLAVSAPTLSYVKKGTVSYSGLTRGMINGSGSNAHFTENGEHLMRLLIWPN